MEETFIYGLIKKKKKNVFGFKEMRWLIRIIYEHNRIDNLLYYLIEWWIKKKVNTRKTCIQCVNLI